MTFDPKAKAVCSLCKKTADEAPSMHRTVRYDWDGNEYEGCLCSECIETFVKTLAYHRRDEFERLVEEARNWKPQEPGENSN